MEITELVRLFRSGESGRRIARVLGHNRRTVMRYRQWADAQGVLEGSMPSSSALAAEKRRQEPTGAVAEALQAARIESRGLAAAWHEAR